MIVDSCTTSLKKFKRPYLCAQCNSNSASQRNNKKKKTLRAKDAENQISVDSSSSYRETLLVNNVENGRRKGSGKGGGGLKRRVNTTLLEHECPFRFTLKANEHGFFISLWGSSGNPLHQGHPKIDPDVMHTQSSSLNRLEKDDLKYVKETSSSRAYLYAGFNELTNGLDELGCEKRLKEVEMFFKKQHDEIQKELREKKEGRGKTCTECEKNLM